MRFSAALLSPEAGARCALPHTLLHPLPTHPPQVFLGEWHQTAVAVKLLLRGGGQAAAGIGSLGDAQQALALPPQVLQKLDEVRTAPG